MIRFRHLKMASRFFSHRFKELHPFEVQANLLNACSQRCVYCRCPEVKTQLMTTAQWLSIIRCLRNLGTIRIKFQGGEPTLRSDFRILCAEVKENGMITAAVSHGVTIASQPNLLDYLDELVVSLDSPKQEVNDSLRGNGSFEGAVKTIELALQKGLRTYVNMILTSRNLMDLEAMLEFCEGKGVMFHGQPVMFEQQSVYGKYFDNTVKNLAITSDQIRDVHRRMAEWKRNGRNILFSSNAYKKVEDWPVHTITTTQSEGQSSCMAGNYYVHIEPNGDVYPCGLNEANFTPKNIIRDGLDEAIRYARKHNCSDCWMVYMNERKFLFSLKPAALQQVIKRG